MSSVTILMDCGHKRTFASKTHCPNDGSQCWCFQCRKNVNVVATVNGWLATCIDCHFKSDTGESEPNANRAATLHLRHEPSHRVNIFYAGRLHRVRRVEQLELPMYELDLGVRVPELPKLPF
jgi:hypothetical protein